MNTKVEMVKQLIDYYPQNLCELKFGNNYQLLVSVILSAQCTDKRVNIVTEELFKILKNPEDAIKLGIEKLIEIIKPCGLFNNKAKSIIQSSEDLIVKFNGQVPSTRQELMSLSGVGEKVASVVLAVGFGVPAIAVDTHVFRLSKRLGLADEDTPTKTMHALEKILPQDMWRSGHFALVLHGRNFCKAQNPRCEECFIKHMCPKNIK